MYTFKALKHIYHLIQELKLELFNEAENGQQSVWDTGSKVLFLDSSVSQVSTSSGTNLV